MSEIMENLKENELPQEIMDLVSGGTTAQIDELYNFYKSHGAKMVGEDKGSAVLGCLMKDRELFGTGQIMLSDKENNTYTVSNIRMTKNGPKGYTALLDHHQFMNYLMTCYAAGRGHCGK